MTAAWIPVWIVGGPLIGLLFLSAIFKEGTSAAAARDRMTSALPSAADRPSGEVAVIARLSGPVSPGAISRLSGPVAPGAIATLSGWRSPGAIAKLSGYKSPGAISRLSAFKSPGAISRLSASRSVGAIATLSAGFFVSKWLGLPLLTRSQAPVEPDQTLLTSNR
jgi:hypothetical protein